MDIVGSGLPPTEVHVQVFDDPAVTVVGPDSCGLCGESRGDVKMVKHYVYT